jgi:hypothetical protein
MPGTDSAEHIRSHELDAGHGGKLFGHSIQVWGDLGEEGGVLFRREAAARLRVRPVGFIDDGQIIDGLAVAPHPLQKGPAELRKLEFQAGFERAALLATCGDFTIGLHPDRRRIQRGVELHHGLPLLGRLADGERLLGVAEPLVFELRIVGVVVVVFRFVIVPNHEVQEIRAHLGEHVVIKPLLLRNLALCCEAGDVALIKNRPAPHAIEGLQLLTRKNSKRGDGLVRAAERSDEDKKGEDGSHEVESLLAVMVNCDITF